MRIELIQEILQYLHSLLRWVLVSVAIFTILYLALRLIQSRRYDDLSARLIVSISALMGLEWLIGVVFMVVDITVEQIEGAHYLAHFTFMTLAFAAACVHFFLRRREMNTKETYRIHLALIIIVSVLIVIGIAVLPPELRWRFYPPAGGV